MKTAIADVTRSLAMQERARASIPGVTQLLSKRPDQFSAGVWPGYFERAAGSQVWDLDGNVYRDMSISGIGANVLGYADAEVDAAVIEAIQRGVSSSLNCPEEVELAELLTDIHPWATNARFARTGGEAMTLAVRLARATTGRDLVAICGYHGWHDWYLAANLGDLDALDGQLLPGLDPAGVPRSLKDSALTFRYNRLDQIQAIVAEHGSRLAAIVMEPQRDAPPAEDFLSGCRELASQSGAVLIFDEISSGLRINTGGIHLTFGVEPDVAVFSKALGNGYAIAAVIGIHAVMQAAQKTFISSTNWTERVGPVAALATLRKHARVDAGARLNQLGLDVQAGWRAAAADAGLPIQVGGMPPLSKFGFDAGDPLEMKALFVQEMLDRGFLASTLYYAMYAHTDEDVALYLEAVADVFGEMKQLVESNGVRSALRGAPSVAGFARLS